MKSSLKTNPFEVMRVNEEKDNRREYSLYPDSEDIYNKFKKEENTDPEDISKVKKSGRDDKSISDNGQECDENVSGNDLDVPGSELDDEQEMIGSEDEENNYYSLGGDGHNNLDEDKDEL